MICLTVKELDLNWMACPLLGFDTETTGVDTNAARLVTAAVIVRDGGIDTTRTWLADPGVEIPPQAAAVHGITTEFARTHGRPVAQVLDEVAEAVANHLWANHPVVAFNAGYDLRLMESELARHGLPTLRDRVGDLRPVIDPLVLDRHFDRYRSGKRTLSDVAGVYGVSARGSAHNAKVDVLLALGLVEALADRYPELLQLDADEIHDLQVDAYREWAQRFVAFRRGRGNPSFSMSTKWL